MSDITTLGQLKSTGYIAKTIKEEMRHNLIKYLRNGTDLFPGIIGFEQSVIPQLQNAILAGHDTILLGERGQAKSRLLRQLTYLLDENLPFIDGCQINDDPLDPICHQCQQKAALEGNDLKISWLNREERFVEKLATPDVAVSDLIGEIDPIKIAEGRHLSDLSAIHFGMIPRAHRSIFCINELPDLSERIQVSLFNLLQERDIQIKGYRIRLPLDVCIVATANPEDYTNRGRIITPLKDRYGAQIRTHYPKTIAEEMDIAIQESSSPAIINKSVLIPKFMRDIIGNITHLARRNPEINQRSGVSLRLTIANYEVMVAQAFRRGTKQEGISAPRISDLPYLLPATTGKLEFETVEDDRELPIVKGIIDRAVVNTYSDISENHVFEKLVSIFDEGDYTLDTGEDIEDFCYIQLIDKVPGLRSELVKLSETDEPACLISALEFILEGLHLTKKLNKHQKDGHNTYSN